MEKVARLESWKEIAAHLGRTERTVQRWAKQRGLPVYRITGSPLGKVFAYRHELDGWLHAHKNPAVDLATGSNGASPDDSPDPGNGIEPGFEDTAWPRHGNGARPESGNTAWPHSGNGVRPLARNGSGSGSGDSVPTDAPAWAQAAAGESQSPQAGEYAPGNQLDQPPVGAGEQLPDEAGSADSESSGDDSQTDANFFRPAGSEEYFPTGLGGGTGGTPAAGANLPPPDHVEERPAAPRPDARTDGRRFWPRVGMPLAAGLVLAVLSGVALWLAGNPAGNGRQAEVAELFLEGRVLTARGADGRALWSRTFAQPLIRPQDMLHPARHPPEAQYAAIRDLDGDGAPEILVTTSLDTSRRFGDEMHCLDASGRPRWSFRPGRKLTFGSGPVDDCYRFRYFLLDDLDGDGRTEIIVNAYNILSFPSLIIMLDVDGQSRGEYVHSGHLTWVVAEDLDGDGKEELLATGINNGYRQGVLAVLDPADLSGASPQHETPGYLCMGRRAGVELYYLRFPVDCLNQATEPYGVTENIMITPERVHIGSGCQLLPDCPMCGHVIFRFGRDLALQDVSADSGYAPYHRCLEEKGLLDHPFDPAEIEELRGVLYWNGQSFQTTPTRNLRRVEQ